MASPFPNPGDKAYAFALPTAALWFLARLLQQLETPEACVPAEEEKTGSTDEPGAFFMALTWVKAFLFAYECRHSLRLTPVLPFPFSFVLN